MGKTTSHKDPLLFRTICVPSFLRMKVKTFRAKHCLIFFVAFRQKTSPGFPTSHLLSHMSYSLFRALRPGLQDPRGARTQGWRVKSDEAASNSVSREESRSHKDPNSGVLGLRKPQTHHWRDTASDALSYWRPGSGNGKPQSL